MEHRDPGDPVIGVGTARQQQDRAGGTIRVAEFVRSFHIGGTESQTLELLRGLPEDVERKVAVTEEVGPFLEEVYALGHRPAEFPFHGSVKRPNTVAQIARLAWWLKRNRVDLLHAHDFYTTLIAVPAARLSNVKVLVGRLDLAHFHDAFQRRALVACTRAADHVVANAGAIRRMLIQDEGVPAARVTVIRNGIDLPRFDQRMRAPLERPLPELGGAPVLAHVANAAHPVKRQEDLLNALALLVAQGSPIHALFIGAGPRLEELKAAAANLHLEHRAHFLGSRTDVAAILSRVDLGVLCSSAEGLSNAIIEGMAAALPMVVTRVGGNPDLIEDGERGFVVSPMAPEQLAGAIARILADRERGRTMGRSARAFVERELTVQQLCERHAALYRAIVGGKGLRAGVPVPRRAALCH